ncbi:hypothetical protein AB0L49_36785 [Streptomyces antimycoticus]|uniref:hypothetical protein n=1 Tax=Streptomyces TaxID=1883 RepID=UPI003444C723
MLSTLRALPAATSYGRRPLALRNACLRRGRCRAIPLRAARDRDDIGYDSLWVFERVLFREDQSGAHGLRGMADVPWLEACREVPGLLATLSMAAVVTQRAQLGTGAPSSQ